MTVKTSNAKRIWDVISEDGMYSFVIWHMSRSSESGVVMDQHVKGFASYWKADTAARECIAANGWTATSR